MSEQLYTFKEAIAILSANGALPTPRFDHSLDEERPAPNGYVYFIQMGDDGPIKIGFSVNVPRRLDSLQSSNPEQLHLRLAMPGSVWDERDYQGDFRRSLIRGEWYRPTADLLELIRAENEDEDDDEADAA